jgi:thiamine-phosphate diphosphorylase
MWVRHRPFWTWWVDRHSGNRTESRTRVQPVICLITPSVHAGTGQEDALLGRVAIAARAGVHLIQIRQAAIDARCLHRVVARSVQAVAGTAARILVNDRLDVALAAGAHGVHLRGGSMSAARVRAVAPPGFLIGRSVHSADESQRMALEGGLDYMLFGTVFATPSKPGTVGVGTAALTAACAGVAVPILALGGMGLQGLVSVGRSGAAGWAAIGLFADCQRQMLPSVIAQAVSAFDSFGEVP